jgi:hypothetical protein
MILFDQDLSWSDETPELSLGGNDTPNMLEMMNL